MFDKRDELIVEKGIWKQIRNTEPTIVTHSSDRKEHVTFAGTELNSGPYCNKLSKQVSVVGFCAYCSKGMEGTCTDLTSFGTKISKNLIELLYDQQIIIEKKKTMPERVKPKSVVEVSNGTGKFINLNECENYQVDTSKNYFNVVNIYTVKVELVLKDHSKKLELPDGRFLLGTNLGTAKELYDKKLLENNSILYELGDALEFHIKLEKESKRKNKND